MLAREPAHLTWWAAPLAAGCVALLLVLSVLAADPGAHHWLHPDSDQAEHTCAVVIFAHGLTPELATVVLTLVAFLFSVPGRAGEVLRPLMRRRRLPPACGPPVS
jgi:hypothetical protein